MLFLKISFIVWVFNFKFCLAFKLFSHPKFIWLLEVSGAKDNGNYPTLNLPVCFTNNEIQNSNNNKNN